MKSTESLIQELYDWRKDKLATCLVIGLMRDSIPEAVERLKSNLPHMEELEYGSRKHKYKRNKPERINVDHDIAERALDIVKEVLPWLEQLAAFESASEPGVEEIPNPT